MQMAFHEFAIFLKNNFVYKNTEIRFFTPRDVYGGVGIGEGFPPPYGFRFSDFPIFELSPTLCS